MKAVYNIYKMVSILPNIQNKKSLVIFIFIIFVSDTRPNPSQSLAKVAFVSKLGYVLHGMQQSMGLQRVGQDLVTE